MSPPDDRRVWRDRDHDGVPDDIDMDPVDPRVGGSIIRDSDGDGVVDAVDFAPNNPRIGTWPDFVNNGEDQGATSYVRDADGDGVPDGLDQYPSDPSRSQWPYDRIEDTYDDNLNLIDPTGSDRLLDNSSARPSPSGPPADQVTADQVPAAYDDQFAGPSGAADDQFAALASAPPATDVGTSAVADYGDDSGYSNDSSSSSSEYASYDDPSASDGADYIA